MHIQFNAAWWQIIIESYSYDAVLIPMSILSASVRVLEEQKFFFFLTVYTCTRKIGLVRYLSALTNSLNKINQEIKRTRQSEQIFVNKSNKSSGKNFFFFNITAFCQRKRRHTKTMTMHTPYKIDSECQQDNRWHRHRSSGLASWNFDLMI